MERKDRPSISEWIKSNSSVSKVAAELNITRPTAYKYIEKYDAGEYNKLPESVIAYFEQRLSNDGSHRIDEARDSLKKEISVLSARLDVERHDLETILERKQSLESEMALMDAEKKEGIDDPDLDRQFSESRMMYKALSKKAFDCNQTLSNLKAVIDEKYRMLTEYEHMEYVPAEGRDVFKIKSSCYIEDGRCMVVHTGDETDDYDEDIQLRPEKRTYYRLHLYSKIGNEFAHLGEYKPVPKRNFFIIDDVVLSAPLYYNIVACIVDPQFNEWDQLKEGDDPPLVETSGANCTGICELKQMK